MSIIYVYIQFKNNFELCPINCNTWVKSPSVYMTNIRLQNFITDISYQIGNVLSFDLNILQSSYHYFMIVKVVN